MRNAMRPGLFDEWLAFERLEPYGERARDEHLAYALAILVNAQTGGKRLSASRTVPWQPEDFLLKHDHDAMPRPRKKREQRLSIDETVKTVNEIMAVMGGRLPQYRLAE